MGTDSSSMEGVSHGGSSFFGWVHGWAVSYGLTTMYAAPTGVANGAWKKPKWEGQKTKSPPQKWGGDGTHAKVGSLGVQVLEGAQVDRI